MVKKYPKAIAAELTKNFLSTDFDCKCTHKFCTYTLVDTDLVDGLEELCDKFAKIDINSGYRCSVHNAEVMGKLGSQHLLGKAADVHTIFASVMEIYYCASKISHFECGGIGLYSNFLHLDVRGHKARWGNTKGE